MAKTYHAIQQWNNWLMQSLGNRLLEAEQAYLSSLMLSSYAKEVLLIGVPQQYVLLKNNSVFSQILLSPLINKNSQIKYIEGDFYELPIASASLDLVILPHALELIDNPRKLLNEACRIVKPEGHIIIFGINPHSLWGLKRRWHKQPHIAPWSTHSISVSTVKNWLKLADFELVKQETFLFRPPLEHHDMLYQKLNILEWIGSKLYSPFGSIYALMAKAKVVPLTPIKIHWKQELSGIQISIPGPSVRNW